jgi:hypothetical protein
MIDEILQLGLGCWVLFICIFFLGLALTIKDSFVFIVKRAIRDWERKRLQKRIKRNRP